MKTCDICDHKRPCVELSRNSSGECVACHECRGERTCWACTDAYEQDRNDALFTAQGNPR